MARVTNIIAKSYTQPLDPDDTELMLASKGYTLKQPQRFCGMFFKLQYGTCATFSTGTITLNGVSSIQSLSKLLAELQATVAGENRTFSEHVVVNVVGTFKMAFSVTLPTLYASRKDICFYNI